MLIQVSIIRVLIELIANKTVLITLNDTALNWSIVARTVGAEPVLLFLDQTAPRH